MSEVLNEIIEVLSGTGIESIMVHWSLLIYSNLVSACIDTSLFGNIDKDL